MSMTEKLVLHVTFLSFFLKFGDLPFKMAGSNW